MDEIILGIDPGAKGALSFLDVNTGSLKVFDMPMYQHTKSNGRKQSIVDQEELYKIVSQNDFTHAFLERVHAMPFNGVVSTFSFGQSYGKLEGVLAAVNKPVGYVDPAKWKGDLGIKKAKDDSLELARELFKDQAELFKFKKHDGRAEASLIALWGMSYIGLMLGMVSDSIRK